MLSPIGIAPALALAALAAVPRTGSRRLRRFPLEPNRAAAGLQHFHQTLRKSLCLRIVAGSGDVVEIIQGREDVGPLPRRQRHTYTCIGSFWGTLDLRGATRVRLPQQRDRRAPAALHRATAQAAPRYRQRPFSGRETGGRWSA